MQFFIQNNSNEPQFVSEIGVHVQAKGKSRALTQAEYNAMSESPTGYPWATLIPILAEKPKAKPAFSAETTNVSKGEPAARTAKLKK